MSNVGLWHFGLYIHYRPNYMQLCLFLGKGLRDSRSLYGISFALAGFIQNKKDRDVSILHSLV